MRKVNLRSTGRRCAATGLPQNNEAYQCEEDLVNGGERQVELTLQSRTCSSGPFLGPEVFRPVLRIPI